MTGPTDPDQPPGSGRPGDDQPDEPSGTQPDDQGPGGEVDAGRPDYSPPGAAPRPRSAAGGSRGASGGGRRHGGAFQGGSELRQVLEELAALRGALSQFRDDRRTDYRILSETTGWVAELLPRVDRLESQATQLAGRVDHLDGQTTSRRRPPNDGPASTDPAGTVSRAPPAHWGGAARGGLELE